MWSLIQLLRHVQPPCCSIGLECVDYGQVLSLFCDCVSVIAQALNATSLFPVQVHKERDLMAARAEGLEAEIQRQHGLHRRELRKHAKESREVCGRCSSWP